MKKYDTIILTDSISLRPGFQSRQHKKLSRFEGCGIGLGKETSCLRVSVFSLKSKIASTHKIFQLHDTAIEDGNVLSEGRFSRVLFRAFKTVYRILLDL